MKRILLTPYPGVVHVTRTRADYQRTYRKLTGLRVDDDLPASTTGRTLPLARKGYADQYLVFAGDTGTLVHELAHVVLKLFDAIGVDPRDAGGEPFCYMLDHLLDEARA